MLRILIVSEKFDNFRGNKLSRSTEFVLFRGNKLLQMILKNFAE